MNVERNAAIDVFRGLSIVLMVFFTLTLGLSASLPDLLSHNKPLSVHIGDFVLPMFLFASGLSIVFFRKKIDKLKASTRAFYVAERFSRLAIIWFWLAPFTAGDFFEMDELMLSAMLFVPSYILAALDSKIIMSVIFTVSVSYVVLSAFGALPDFSGHYLGGFAAAPFYLPVMLWGVIAGREMGNLKRVMAVQLVAAIILLAAVPPYKMTATPSFMAVAALLSTGVFWLCQRRRNGILEYLGKNPIRYWLMMILLIIVPLKLYALYALLPLPLGLDWMAAVMLALACTAALYLVSRTLDMAYGRIFKPKATTG